MGPVFGKRASGEQNPMDVTRHGDYNAMEIINGVRTYDTPPSGGPTVSPPMNDTHTRSDSYRVPDADLAIANYPSIPRAAAGWETRAR